MKLQHLSPCSHFKLKFRLLLWMSQGDLLLWHNGHFCCNTLIKFFSFLLCGLFLKCSRSLQIKVTGLHLLLLLQQHWAAFNSCWLMNGSCHSPFTWCWGRFRIITVTPLMDGGDLLYCGCRMCFWKFHQQKRYTFHVRLQNIKPSSCHQQKCDDEWGNLCICGCRWHSSAMI